MLPTAQNHRSHLRPQRLKRSTILLILLLLFWSITMGWGLSLIAESSPASNRLAPTETRSYARPNFGAIAQNKVWPKDGAIDTIPENLKLAEEVYLENCANCHIGVPPAMLPTETWRAILLDRNHYGIMIKPLLNPFRQLVWNYLLNYSRSVFAAENVPDRVGQSRFFKALHPNVTLPQSVNLKGCVSCHPGASQYHFATLAQEKQ